MLANPYVAVATVLTAIVTSLIVFGRQAKEVTMAQEAMARVSDKVSDSVANQKMKIEQQLSDKATKGYLIAAPERRYFHGEQMCDFYNGVGEIGRAHV